MYVSLSASFYDRCLFTIGLNFTRVIAISETCPFSIIRSVSDIIMNDYQHPEYNLGGID